MNGCDGSETPNRRRQHLQVDQGDVRRYAGEATRETLTFRILGIGPEDAGYVRAMTKKIGAGQPGNKALAVDDAVVLAVAVAKVVMRVDAAVDHGHPDASAVPPGLPGDVGAHGLSGDIQTAGHRAIGRDVSIEEPLRILAS
jgi:hypothetical protein